MIQSTKALYNKMIETPGLCGKFELVGKTIFWKLYDGFDIYISIEPPDTYFSIEKKLFWLSDKIGCGHPCSIWEKKRIVRIPQIRNGLGVKSIILKRSK